MSISAAVSTIINEGRLNDCWFWLKDWIWIVQVLKATAMDERSFQAWVWNNVQVLQAEGGSSSVGDGVNGNTAIL